MLTHTSRQASWAVRCAVHNCTVAVLLVMVNCIFEIYSGCSDVYDSSAEDRRPGLSQ
jgi:hypothetical protein